MDMPPGYKRLFAYNDDNQCMVEPFEDTNKALTLLKEMASALLVCNEALTQYKDRADENPDACVASYEALTKFEEWK